MRKIKNTIEEKQKKLQNYKEISSRVLNMVTDVIEQLSCVNDCIDNTIEDIINEKTSLQTAENELNQQKTKNARIIEKFKALVE